MPRDKAVSIFFELGELEGVVEAAQALAIDLQGEPWPDNREGARKLYSIGSVLALLTCRIRLLRQGIEGSVDPALLLARHNEVPSREPGAVGDLKLLPQRKPGNARR
jgi:hypothetical protein